MKLDFTTDRQVTSHTVIHTVQWTDNEHCLKSDGFLTKERDWNDSEADMCQDPKRTEILDPQDPRSRILQDLGSYIFIFSWDPRDLESFHGNIAVGS